jgi:uncharacterized protein YegP (UPF0339 family)
MNAKLTRIASDAESDESLTDWARLRALTDEEIETAIAGDPDSYAIEQGEELGRKGASFRYQIYRDPGESWRWRLVSANGEILAVGGQGFPSRKAVAAAISSLRDALLGARSEAA